MAIHSPHSPRSLALRRCFGRALLASACAAGILAFGWPVLAGQGAPERRAPRSLLPDDLDTPTVAPGAPTALPLPFPRRDAPAANGAPAASPATGPTTGPATGPTALPEAGAEPAFPAGAGAEIGAEAGAAPGEERSSNPLAGLAGPMQAPEQAGILSVAHGGYGEDLFQQSDARFVSALLQRIDAPLASRWMQIVLQRALLSEAKAPAGAPAATWLAARATALQEMGAAADAHRLLLAIDPDRYDGALDWAALRSAMATADPVALCPLSAAALRRNSTPTWGLVDAMCLAILGDDVTSAARFDALRRQGRVSAFDIGLAERVASTTGMARRGANPEWGEVQRLTAWRLGLATAAGLDIPSALLRKATPAEAGWLVRLPGLPLADRAAAAGVAAATGAFSSAEAERLLAAEAVRQPDAGRTAAALLRRAGAAPDAGDRAAALRQLWGLGAAGSLERYGWQVAAARAASRLPVSEALVADSPAIAESLLAAGMVPAAAAWWALADDAGGAVRVALWAELVAAVPAVPLSAAYYDDWARGVPAHRARLLAAGLEGLGRGTVGSRIERLDNEWTRALDRAVAARNAGEVITLSAIAFRGSWADVPPDYLRRVAAALATVGRGDEARLIVAEAAARG